MDDSTHLTQDDILQIQQSFHSSLLDGDHLTDDLLSPKETQLLNEFEKIIKQSNKEKFIPALPQVVSNLFTEIEKEDASIPDIIHLIKKDPSLSGQLIRMANSAYFNPAGADIGSINHALSLIGLSRLKGLVMGAMLESQMLIKSAYYKKFSPQLVMLSLQTAHLSKVVSRKDYQSTEYETHYLMGLLFHTGKIISFNILNTIIQNNPEFTTLNPNVMHKVMKDYAHLLTVDLAFTWKLPFGLIDAIKTQQFMTMEHMDTTESKILFKANLITSIHNLLTLKMISTTDAGEFLKKEGIDSKQFNSYFNK